MNPRKLERRKWRAGWARHVVALLARRPDLRGVSSRADYIDEAIRWNV